MEEKMSWPFRNKKSFIRFYSLYPGLESIHPVVPAKSINRQWMIDYKSDTKCPYHKVVNALKGHSANCPGINKLVDVGWVLTAPADFTIETFGQGKDFKFEVPILFQKDGHWISAHDASITKCLLDRPNDTLETLIKIDTPWRIQASDDIVLLQQHVPYGNQPNFTVANGILDPKYSYEANVQLFWHVLEGKVTIKAGTPLVHYIPISRKSLSMSNYDFIVEAASEKDKYTEEAFNYAKSSSFKDTTTLSERIQRTIKIISNNPWR
jgi:hypothetical protein